jgi:putative FmdB family regulatory protein
MPIYAYRCASCGHAKDVLQKMSDPVLSICPACGAEAFTKQVTAAGFQLKGSGWYVTDFREGAKTPAKADAAKETAKAEGANGGTAETPKTETPAAAPAAAPAPAAGPAPAPASTAPPAAPK